MRPNIVDFISLIYIIFHSWNTPSQRSVFGAENNGLLNLQSRNTRVIVFLACVDLRNYTWTSELECLSQLLRSAAGSAVHWHFAGNKSDSNESGNLSRSDKTLLLLFSYWLCEVVGCSPLLPTRESQRSNFGSSCSTQPLLEIKWQKLTVAWVTVF